MLLLLRAFYGTTGGRAALLLPAPAHERSHESEGEDEEDVREALLVVCWLQRACLAHR